MNETWWCPTCTTTTEQPKGAIEVLHYCEAKRTWVNMKVVAPAAGEEDA